MRVLCVCGIALCSTLALALAAPAAPDISGTYWTTSYSPKIQVLGGGDPPLNAAGRAAYDMNQARLKDGSIVDKARRVCVPDGVPRVLATPYPFEIFQLPAGQVTFLYEMNHQVRVIVMDKSLPPRQALIVDPKYNGHSVGRWDGDTLIVETNNLRGAEDSKFDGWLDVNGSPYSEQAKFTERIRRPTYDHLQIDMTVDDPKAYTKPWTVRVDQRLIIDQDLIEFECNENQQFRQHVK